MPRRRPRIFAEPPEEPSNPSQNEERSPGGDIPVSELGHGPAEQWVMPQSIPPLPTQTFDAPAPAPPAVHDDSWAVPTAPAHDAGDDVFDDLLQAPGGDTHHAPPAPTAPQPPPPPSPAPEPLGLPAASTELSSALSSLDEFLEPAAAAPPTNEEIPDVEPAHPTMPDFGTDNSAAAFTMPASEPASGGSADDVLSWSAEPTDSDSVAPAAAEAVEPDAAADDGWTPLADWQPVVPADNVDADNEAGGDDLADLFADDSFDTPPATEAAAKPVDSSVYVAPVQRLIDYDRVGELVDRITDYIGNRPELAAKIANFELTRDTAKDQAQRAELVHIVTRDLAGVSIPVTSQELPEVLDVVYDELIGLGPIGDPWRDPAVTEIMIDGWDKIYVEVAGKLRTTKYRFRNREHAEAIARDLAQRVSGRTVSPTIPLVTAELPQARVNFAYRPVVRSGLAITLRKLDGVMGMKELLQFESLTDEMAEFLSDVVSSRAAVLVSGGTGVGKTTLLNALSESIGRTERVITIEDSYELQLASNFVVSMQTKEAASSDDENIVTQADLLRNSLRQRPDRIILGEVRDGEAASVMLAAANTGHEGTMTTIHANTADSALNVRLTNLARTGDDVTPDIARWEIAEAFDLVVQGNRSRYDGRRFVSEIAEVTTEGLDGGGRIKLNTIFSGVAHVDGPVEFKQVGEVRKHGRLAERLIAANANPERWVASK